MGVWYHSSLGVNPPFLYRFFCSIAATILLLRLFFVSVFLVGLLRVI